MFYALHSARRCGRGLHAGFTLIELLVVVLIIGILAAITIPQYQVAVSKSKLSRALPLFRSITDAQDRYYMQTGEYTADLDKLDIRIPYTSKVPYSGEDRYRYEVPPVGYFSLSPNHFLVWSGDGGGFIVDYFGKSSAGDLGARGICYPIKVNTTGHKVCKSFGRDTGRMSSASPPTPVYALEF